MSAHHKWDKRRTEIVLMSIRLMLLFVSSSLPANHIITMQNTLESIGLHPSIIRIIRSDQCPDAILASGMILLSRVMTVGTVTGTEFYSIVFYTLEIVFLRTILGDICKPSTKLAPILGSP